MCPLPGVPFLAASHPIWIAPLVARSPLARWLVNFAVLAAGDAVEDASMVPGFVAALVAHVVAAIALSALASSLVAKLVRRKYLSPA